MANHTKNQVSYGLSAPLNLEPPQPIIAQRAPTAADTAAYGTVWVDQPNNTAYILTSITAGAANWENTTGGAGAFSSLTVQPGSTTLNATAAGATITLDCANAITITSASALANAIAIDASAGGVQITSDESTTIAADSNTNAAISLNAANGGISINNGNAFPIAIGSANAISLVSTGNIANSLKLQTNGGAAETIFINSILGTGNDAIGILSTVGGISLSSGAPGVASISINASTNGGGVTLTGGASAAGGINLQAGGFVSMLPVTSGAASPTAAVTLNSRVGVVTFTGFTTAAAASQTFTITNNTISITSGIFVTISNTGTNTDALMTLVQVTPAAGSFTVTVTNTGGQALNGSVIITFWAIS